MLFRALFRALFTFRIASLRRPLRVPDYGTGFQDQISDLQNILHIITLIFAN